MAQPLELTNPYDISSGDVVMALTKNTNSESTASMQVVLDDFFDGTTATARFLQSNNLSMDSADWNYLPEEPLTLASGSNLLQTNSFTCRYIAVEILVGNATAGTATFHQNFQ